MSIKPAVYVCSFFRKGVADIVQELLPEVKVINIIPQSEEDRIISAHDLKVLQDEAEILFCDFYYVEAIVKNSKRLKWLHITTAGIEFMVRLYGPQNSPPFLVTRSTAHGIIVGEYVMAQVLALERKLLHIYRAQQQKQWIAVKLGRKRDISSLTMCVIGVGEMGKEVARRCKQLGMTVHGITRSPPTAENKSENVDIYRTFQDLSTALGQCDYMCCALPSTPLTKGLLSGDILRACKNKKPILISVGRGDVIDEITLVTAIREGWLGGAVLDVAPQEPLPVTSPLWTLPNVIISPRVAGIARTEHDTCSFAADFVENYRRFCKGEKMNALVDFEKGY